MNCNPQADGVARISDIGCVLQGAIGYILGFAGLVFFVLLIVAGFRFITSGGDPKAVEGARKTITSAVFGLIVILVSYLILVIISEITGVNVRQFQITVPQR